MRSTGRHAADLQGAICFSAYGVILQGDRIVSMSAWNSERDAQSADEVARNWVAKNVDMAAETSVIGDFASSSLPSADSP